jgi:hypothetical protein
MKKIDVSTLRCTGEADSRCQFQILTGSPVFVEIGRLIRHHISFAVAMLERAACTILVSAVVARPRFPSIFFTGNSSSFALFSHFPKFAKSSLVTKLFNHILPSQKYLVLCTDSFNTICWIGLNMAPIAVTEPHASEALEPIAIIGMGEMGS